MKKCTLLFIFFLFISQSFAQEFEVPEDYELKTEEDYEAYEDEALDCANWLLDTPLNEELKMRTKANKFLLKYVEGSPKITIIINPKIINFLDSSPYLLMIYMAGWVKFSFETEKFDDVFENSFAAINSTIDVYQRDRNYISKDKHMEKYVKMRAKGTLKAYVEKNA